MDHGEHLMNHPEHRDIDWGAYFTAEEVEAMDSEQLHREAHGAQAFLRHHHGTVDTITYVGEWHDTPWYDTPWYEQGEGSNA
jgi:hypothetical protein